MNPEICSASSKRLLCFVQCSMTSDDFSSSIALLMFIDSWRISSVNSRRLVSFSIVPDFYHLVLKRKEPSQEQRVVAVSFHLCLVVVQFALFFVFALYLHRVDLLAKDLVISAWFKVFMPRFKVPAVAEFDSWDFVDFYDLRHCPGPFLSLMLTSLRQLAQCAE